MPSTIRYNTLRLLLLIVVAVVCFLAGARGPLLVVLAVLISFVLSYVLLGRWRRGMIDELAKVKVGRLNVVARINDRIEAANLAEDVALDAQLDGSARPSERDHPDTHGALRRDDGPEL